MKLTVLALLWVAAAAFAADFHIPFERYTLKNGLRVVLSRDNSVPVVSVYLMYDVGARSEEKGRTGFAHLFEHMMFEGSKNLPKGMQDRIVEGNGGVMNGSTHPDYTDYLEVLPSNKLALALWAESDKMLGLAITAENLANQKEAVKQERRLRIDNQPYALAVVEKWPELAFGNWSSAHSMIGSFEDLNASTVADVAKFFKTHYAPNNCVLSIAGDIDLAETKKLVEAYFGPIPPQPQPKRPDLTEPPRTEPRSEVFRDPQARVPAVLIGWPGPKRRSPDYYALNMLDLVLTGGDSSRFYLNLLKGKQSVISFEATLGWPYESFQDYRDPGNYTMNVVYKPGFTGKQIVGQVEEEIAKVSRDGLAPGELDRVRTFFRSARINAMQSSLSRAQLLAQYELMDGDPNWANTELAQYMAVTEDAIRAVAKKYFVPARRSVLDIVPAPPKEEKK